MTEATYAELPANELHTREANPRNTLGDLTDLIASIKQIGVLQPLRVTVRAEGGYTILAGHRRHAAAAEAGLKAIPCVIVTADQAHAAATAVHENLHRAGLSEAEMVRGVQGMLDANFTIADTAKGLGLKRQQVKDLSTAAQANEDIRINLNSGTFTLEEALKVNEIAARDEEAYTTILEQASNGSNVTWAINDATRRLARIDAQAQAESLHEKTGVVILEERPYWTGSTDRLEDEAAIGEHIGQSCYRIWPTSTHQGEPEIEHWCIKTSNHRPEGAKTETTPEQKEQLRRTKANNVAWKRANEIRAAWLTESVYTRATFPKKHIDALLNLNILNPYSGEEVARAVRIMDPKATGWIGSRVLRETVKTEAARLRLHLLATIAKQEDRMEKTIWRADHPCFAEYLTLLTSLGYTLTPPEAQYVEHITNGVNPSEATYESE